MAYENSTSMSNLSGSYMAYHDKNPWSMRIMFFLLNHLFEDAAGNFLGFQSTAEKHHTVDVISVKKVVVKDVKKMPPSTRGDRPKQNLPSLKLT